MGILMVLGSCASPERDVRAVLETQVDDWNRGDIDAFMEGYWKSDDLVFRSGDKEVKGWQPTLERYKKAYPTREKMGKLTFSDLVITMTSETEAEVTGRFALLREPDIPTGKFKLLFRKFPEGWRIVRDETLAD